MTQEGVALAFLTALIGLLGAAGYFIRSRAKGQLLNNEGEKIKAQTAFIEAQTRQKVAEADALREKAELDTGAKYVEAISGTITEQRNDKAQLKADLRLATDQRDTATINWQNAQTMIETKNERITQLESEKTKLEGEKLKVENELRRVNTLLENTQRRLEYCLDKQQIDFPEFDEQHTNGDKPHE